MLAQAINFGRVAIATLCVIIVALCTWYVVEGRFWSYLPNLPTADAVAKKLVDEKRDASDCFKTYQIGWSYPPIEESRFACVREYAKLTKNPSACELLMPSDYGWDCLGAAEEPNSRQCWFDFGSSPTQVGSGDTYVTFPECAHSPKKMEGNRCCELADILYIKKQESCKPLQDHQILYDQCQELLARRELAIDMCSSIYSPHVRSSCEVSVRALLKK